MNKKEFLLKYVLLTLSAFYDGEYSNFSWNDIKKSSIPKHYFKESLDILQKEDIITNCTKNGYYNRFIINYEDCPSFIFSDFSFSIKLFLLHYYLVYDLEEEKTYNELLNDLGYSIKKLYTIRYYFNNTLHTTFNEYLKSISYLHLSPSHPRYPLIKTYNGYQIDSEPEAKNNRLLDNHELRIKRILNSISRNNIGHFLMQKIKTRGVCNPERFGYTDIDEDFLNKLYDEQNGCDFYTGFPFNNLDQISVDRVDSDKPYLRDNVVLTFGKINVMKNDIKLYDFIKICNIISKRFPLISNEKDLNIF